MTNKKVQYLGAKLSTYLHCYVKKYILLNTMYLCI
jgi:hypothetical protein